LQLVNSAVRSAATCQLSCTLLAQMTLVISAATCGLSCNRPPHLDVVHKAAVFHLNCVLRMTYAATDA